MSPPNDTPENPAPENPALPEPGTAAGRAGLAALLAEPRAALVALDYDGTLAPIVPDPARAYPAPGAVDVLVDLAPRVALVAVVTGRPVRDVRAFLDLDGTPGLSRLVVAGQYGLERYVAGHVETPPPDPGVQAVRERLPSLLRDAPAGVRVEDKGHALVVHTRRAEEPGKALEALVPALRGLAAEVGLDAEPGRYVLELRKGGVDKGAALRRLVEEVGARTVMFLGDDLGDVPAYQAVEDLRGEGVAGLTVCSASAEVAGLAERADLVVPGPEGVVRLLTGVLAALG